MHLLAILAVFILSLVIRCQSIPATKVWSKRWHQTLFLFCFPPLMLLSMAAVILYMGCHGEMFGVRVGSVGCVISGALILLAGGCWLHLAYQGSRTIRQLQKYPQQAIGDTTARIIELDVAYSAQIGFWQSELVISRGLLNTLDQEHLKAVIAHEQAHLYYRDTFSFFWLGWIRSFSFWLPQTEALWQELLLLRELRADHQAANSVDFLLIAESLFTVAKYPWESPMLCIPFNDLQTIDRLEERIDFLLSQTQLGTANSWHNLSWFCLLILPVLIIPLHY